MKYAWIVYTRDTLNSGFNNNAFDWMVSTAKKYDIELDVLFCEDIRIEIGSRIRFYCFDRPIAVPEFVIMRCYDFVIGHLLESFGIRVINSTLSMQLSRNKALTANVLRVHGISMPEIVYLYGDNYDYLHSKYSGNPFVVKRLVGSKGEGVYLINERDDYDGVISGINTSYQVQEYISESSGKDIRVYVIGETAVGCVQRISDSDFRSNYSLGGRVERLELTDDISSVAVSASKALGLEFAGVDLLVSDRGLLVCEVNGNAGFRSITKVSDIDMVDLLFRYIVKG